MVVMQPRYSSYQDDYDLRRENAIVIIQCQIRKFLAIRHVDRLRYKREMLRKLQEKYSAIKIQRFYRQQLNKKYENAAIMIQKHVRKLLAMKYVERIKAQRRNSFPVEAKKWQDEEERAAILLQSQIRKLLAIRRVDRMKDLRQLQALERLQQNKENNAGMEVGDEKLSELRDRLSESVTTTPSEIKKSHLKYDDYTAAVIIQRSWKGYNCRRLNSDVLEKLAKIRLNLKNDEHHELPVQQIIDIYLPLFYSSKLRKRQTAVSFMNELTENSQEFVGEFVKKNGIPAILGATPSNNPTTTAPEITLQKELVKLLFKCLESESSEKYINGNIEELLKFLVGNVKSQDRKLMLESCKCIHKICQNSRAPGILKELQFPFYVSQWRRQLVSENGQCGDLQKAEETLRLINALPE